MKKKRRVAPLLSTGKVARAVSLARNGSAGWKRGFYLDVELRLGGEPEGLLAKSE